MEGWDQPFSKVLVPSSAASVTAGTNSDYFLGSLEKENQEAGEYNIAAINTVIKCMISFSDIHNNMAADCMPAMASSCLHLHEQSYHAPGLLIGSDFSLK